MLPLAVISVFAVSDGGMGAVAPMVTSGAVVLAVVATRCAAFVLAVLFMRALWTSDAR